MSKKLWVESYRPQTISECILPESVKKQAHGMVDSENLNHLILCGGAGTGKTSLAKAIARETNADTFMFNGSDGTINIEFFREKLDSICSTTSLDGKGKTKVIIIDEADGLSPLIQAAFRNFLEKYSSTCRFIFTCNYPDKIMDAIHSRCATIDYKFDKKELNVLIKQFAMRTVDILKKEHISYDIEALKGVILKFFPDNRKILNELQKYANLNGCIDDGILDELKSNVDELFSAILTKDFPKCKDWLANNSTSSIFNVLYKEGEGRIPANMLPLWILKLGEYQKYHGIVPNQELNILAALTEYMSESE